MYSPRKICPLCGTIGLIVGWGLNNQKRARYKCKACRKTFCNRTGTIRFKSHLDEKKWRIISNILALRTHPSGSDLGRLFGKSVCTGQRLLRKTRQILPSPDENPVSGIVEFDETTFNGEWIGGAKQRKGKLKLVQLRNRNTISMNRFVESLTTKNTAVFTDEWRGYDEIRFRRNHLTVCHAKEFVSGFCKAVHTNSIEGVWGHAKPLAWHTYRKYPNIKEFMKEVCFQFNFNYTERCKYLTAQFSRPRIAIHT